MTLIREHNAIRMAGCGPRQLVLSVSGLVQYAPRAPHTPQVRFDALTSNMNDTPFNYDNVKGYSLEPADQEELIRIQNECTFMWSTRAGWPVGVIMSYVYQDGCFWLSVSSLRVRVQAVRRDPRVSISITSKGVDHAAGRSLTLKGRCEVLNDRATIDWFLPELAQRLRPGDAAAQRLFVQLNDTPNRRVLKVTPLERIGYDGQKMRRATADAVASGRAIGPG